MSNSENIPAQFLILDIETDGIGTFRPPTHTPIEISYRALDNKKKCFKIYSKFVKGIKKINWSGGVKCPYTVEQVNKNGISLEEIVQEINKITNGNTCIVGHNIDYDIGCINRHSKIRLNNTKTYDTLKNSINVCKIPGKWGYKYPSLQETAKHFGISFDAKKYHTSSYDVEITEKCFFKLTGTVLRRYIRRRKKKVEKTEVPIRRAMFTKDRIQFMDVLNESAEECPFCGIPYCSCGYYG